LVCTLLFQMAQLISKNPSHATFTVAFRNLEEASIVLLASNCFYVAYKINEFIRKAAI